MHDNAKRKGSTQNMYLPNALQNLFLIATMLIFQAAVGLKKKKKGGLPLSVHLGRT